MTTTDEAVPVTEEWFPDYCRHCVDECGCGRWDTVTEPFEVHWPGPGSMLTGRYECDNGHQWKCFWSAELLTMHPQMGE